MANAPTEEQFDGALKYLQKSKYWKNKDFKNYITDVYLPEKKVCLLHFKMICLIYLLTHRY